MKRWLLEELPAHARRQAEEQLGMIPRVSVRNIKIKDDPEPSKNKYFARKVSADGISFDSKKECRCYLLLKARQEKGEIEGLRVQVKFSLFDPGGNCRGEHIGTYRCDYVWKENGQLKVGDAKSEKTRRLRDWPRTKALMRACHGIEVIEF